MKSIARRSTRATRASSWRSPRRAVAKGASYSLPSDQIKTPGSILVSAWSKAQGVSGSKDDAYAIYIDVNYADGTNLHQVTAPFEPGTHDWQYASVVVPVPKAVARFSIHLLLRGDHTGTVWFDDVYAATYQEGMPKYEGSSEAYEIPARVIEMRRRLPGLQEKMATLEGLVNEAESKGLDASLLRVSLSVAQVFTPLLAEDASLEVADYPKDMIDFRILGREETLRRIESLALLRGRPDGKGPGPGDRGGPGDPEEPSQPEEVAAATAQAGHRRERGLHVRREAGLPLRHPRTGRRT